MHKGGAAFSVIMLMSMIDGEEDRRSFDALYEKYRDRAYAVAYKLLGDPQLAEDAALEAFFRLAGNFSTIRDMEYHKLDYYIVITVRNAATDILRKEKKHRELLEYNDSLDSGGSDISQYDIIELKDCISRLPQEDKDILYMRSVLGLEYSDIAAALGIKQAAARKRLQYARNRLKKLMGEGDN